MRLTAACSCLGRDAGVELGIEREQHVLGPEVHRQRPGGATHRRLCLGGDGADRARRLGVDGLADEQACATARMSSARDAAQQQADDDRGDAVEAPAWPSAWLPQTPSAAASQAEQRRAVLGHHRVERRVLGVAQRLAEGLVAACRARTGAPRSPGSRLRTASPRRGSRSSSRRRPAAPDRACGGRPRRPRRRRRRRRSAPRRSGSRSRAPCRSRRDGARRPADRPGAGRRAAACRCRCRPASGCLRKASPSCRWPRRRRTSSPRWRRWRRSRRRPRAGNLPTRTDAEDARRVPVQQSMRVDPRGGELAEVDGPAGLPTRLPGVPTAGPLMSPGATGAIRRVQSALLAVRLGPCRGTGRRRAGA